MPRYVCCVPGCSIVASDGVPLHYFPNPETFTEKFQVWVKNIGGDIASLDSATILKTKRICRRHFETQFLYPNNRLSKLAVPTLLLPSGDISAAATSPLVPDQGCCEYPHPNPQMRSFRIGFDICIRIRIRNNRSGCSCGCGCCTGRDKKENRKT